MERWPRSKARKMVGRGEERGGRWEAGKEKWSSQPRGWLWEGIVCAALNGRALAAWRGPGEDTQPEVRVVLSTWYEEARLTKLEDRQEAERLEWVPVGRSECLTGAILPRVVHETEVVRESDGWSTILEVGGDAVVNWRRNPYKLYRARGLGFMRVTKIAKGWEDRVQMPVQRPLVTVYKMVEGSRAWVELNTEVEGLASWEHLFTSEALKRLERFRETNAADWRATTLGMSGHRQRQVAGKEAG